MHTRKISVIGLGYVGLPVAVAFGKQARTVGFDINEIRLNELRSGIDRTNEVTTTDLESASIVFTSDIKTLAEQASIDKIQQHLGYMPTHPVAEGLNQATEYEKPVA